LARNADIRGTEKAVSRVKRLLWLVLVLGFNGGSDLVKLGHEVTVFEALHAAGGVLMYGFRVSFTKAIVQSEAEYVKKLGANLKLNTIVGRTYTIPELMHKSFDAVFIGSGAGLPQFTGCLGENLGGVYSANEFLIRVNLMKAYKFPEYKHLFE
jgi:glutamate synthase (NADPH/NADH) small chain